MNVVERAEKNPGMCVFTTELQGPFVDTGFHVNAKSVGVMPRAYLAVPVAEEIGRTIGMVPKQELEAANARVDELLGQVEDMTFDLQEAKAKLSAVHSLEREGFRPKKRPGRPPKVQA